MASFHALWTLMIFICFIVIVLWAYSSRRKKEFDEAANLVFADEEKGDKKTGEDNK
ncbi:CcoQ/FixQ family Cbb3-type cytochrome c oxidase assembly chaperone [Grimontia hollisae]|uniref:Cytochrome c oxidase subunit CcoQ n=2 Tax=Grimontia hollisae TaxID=673 RepID=D0IAD7_GRIHO|nr:CcoQ/FixQ family Cbb3-type cytochrome c oxidase assembly chaperone [Grimontia hollisae]AMG31831.1 CcoQ/FixQ family Cbb3-type cytochrome c oxidase assembly chaperone [Grimontia hollisae]EEY70855.1 cytochrome c oxidase subunit CcoQ [Grimontia hollisae CIP 101886]MDF2186262.1 CcoQ/FixQ family Cbb3-type cytochrome c oxidase assembly chaperone [Grimontia hollisae]STO44672.1 Cbb3-type cytochrome oxidase, subunit 3 [Grimontia hollisae]STO57503.1 Cbb3-type cytochrome oxidase, subunit 3 [Grimontia h